LGKWAVLTVKAISAAIIFSSVLFAVLIVGPAVETKWFPVVSKLRVTKVLSGEEAGTSVVYAEYTKLRSCEYVGIAWFKGNPNGVFERVPITLLRKEGDQSSPNRPIGTQKAGPWIIGVPPDELRQGSFARLYHRCFPFWTSTTDFWP
jgi:hypothetical protein